MGLELLEYQVFANQQAIPAGAAGNTAEIDLPKSVPQGETWRVDRISAAVLIPKGQGNPFVLANPILFVYDQVNPSPATLPVDVTALETYAASGQSNPPPIASNGTIYFLDADDLAAPITLLAGYQLACVFYAPWSTTAWLAAVRIQYSRFKGTGATAQPVAA